MKNKIKADAKWIQKIIDLQEADLGISKCVVLKISKIILKIYKMPKENHIRNRAGLNIKFLAICVLCLLNNGCSGNSDEFSYPKTYQNSPYSTPYRPQYQPPQYQPRSRNYNNPYEIPQNQYGSGYYGNDQYYVAPRYYYNVEPDTQNFNSNTRY